MTEQAIVYPPDISVRKKKQHWSWHTPVKIAAIAEHAVRVSMRDVAIKLGPKVLYEARPETCHTVGHLVATRAVKVATKHMPGGIPRQAVIDAIGRTSVDYSVDASGHVSAGVKSSAFSRKRINVGDDDDAPTAVRRLCARRKKPHVSFSTKGRTVTRDSKGKVSVVIGTLNIYLNIDADIIHQVNTSAGPQEVKEFVSDNVESLVEAVCKDISEEEYKDDGEKEEEEEKEKEEGEGKGEKTSDKKKKKKGKKGRRQ